SRCLLLAPRSLPWLLAAGPEDRLQHLVGVVAIDHRAQELADNSDAFGIDVPERACDAIGLQPCELCHQGFALGGGVKEALPAGQAKCRRRLANRGWPSPLRNLCQSC